VFLDESGLLMAPLVRRSWAPKGQTPVFYQRTRYREKVSAIAAITVSPRRRRVGLYFSLLPDHNVTSTDLIRFLRQLRNQLGGRIILVWDRLLAHRSKLMQEFLAGQSAITVEYLPPYAPELNPVEMIWGYLKMNPLANLAAHDIDELYTNAWEATYIVKQNQPLLRSFIKATPLSFSLR
jgi:transposase